MNKRWYEMSGVWGGIIAIVAGIAALFGFNLTAADQASMAENLAAIGSLLGGIIAIVGRILAERRAKAAVSAAANTACKLIPIILAVSMLGLSACATQDLTPDQLARASGGTIATAYIAAYDSYKAVYDDNPEWRATMKVDIAPRLDAAKPFVVLAGRLASAASRAATWKAAMQEYDAALVAAEASGDVPPSTPVFTAPEYFPPDFVSDLARAAQSVGLTFGQDQDSLLAWIESNADSLYTSALNMVASVIEQINGLKE